MLELLKWKQRKVRNGEKLPRLKSTAYRKKQKEEERERKEEQKKRKGKNESKEQEQRGTSGVEGPEDDRVSTSEIGKQTEAGNGSPRAMKREGRSKSP